jgi:hypothetical protein
MVEGGCALNAPESMGTWQVQTILGPRKSCGHNNADENLLKGRPHRTVVNADESGGEDPSYGTLFWWLPSYIKGRGLMGRRMKQVSFHVNSFFKSTSDAVRGTPLSSHGLFELYLTSEY